MEASTHLVAKDNRLYLALGISLCLFVLIGATASGTAQWPGFGREARYDFGDLNARTIVAADFNGDGVSDLAVTYVYTSSGGGQDRVSVLLSNGDGTLQTPTTTYAIGAYSRQSAAGDFNGDGKTDLVIAVSNDTSSGIDVLLGNGDGTFQTAVFYPLDGSPTDIAVGDFNQDNHSDVAVKTNDGGRTPNVDESGISVLLSRNDGTFLPATQYSIPNFVVGSRLSVKAGDFNGDGKLDLVTLNTTASAVSVLPGRGDGTFGDPITSPSPSSSSLLAAADFNRDGKLDLVVGKAILLGQGDGTFASGVSYSDLSIWRVTTADFNGDGLVDLAVVVISNDYYDVEVLLGNGDGTFQPPLTFPVAQGAPSLVIGDFNADGKPDLAYEGGLFGYFVSVLLNSVFTPEPCRKPGPTTLITDAAGDATDRNPSHDIESVSVSETFSQDGEQLLVFKLKVADLHSIQPYNYWNLSFGTPFRRGGYMQMYSVGGQVSFQVSYFGNTHFNGSYDENGTITFVISRRDLELLPGDEITGVWAYVYYQSGDAWQKFDDAPNTLPSTVNYTVGGSDPCVMPTPTPTPSPSPSPSPSATPTPGPAPQLLTEESTGLAIALDSVTLMRDPFPLTAAQNFSADRRTRIMIFASGLELLPGETAAAVTAQAEDVQFTGYTLPVEYVGKVPDCDSLMEIVVKLPASIAGNDKLWMSINVHGAVSNKVPVRIKIP